MYIHGYLSSPNGSTAMKLKKKFGERYNVVCPEVSADPVKSLEITNKAIKETKPMVIIGSSMGGLYALASESGKTPLVLVNPLLKPVPVINEHFLNKEFAYNSSREDGAKTSTITEKELNEFASIDVEALLNAKKGCVGAVVSLNDELLGRSALEALEGKGAWITTGKDFGHRCSGSCFDKICGLVSSVEEI